MCDDSDDFISNSTSENISCSISILYDTDLFRGIAAFRSAVSIFSLLCCITVILLIVCYKKYHFFPQRLILYLAVVSAFHSCVLSLGRVNYDSVRQLKDTYCIVNGFLELYSSWVELLLIACIITHLLLLLVFGIESSRMEVVHLLVSFILPSLWCWVPLLGHTYGTTGPWCGIRVHYQEEIMSGRGCHNTYTLGTVLRFILWQIPVYSVFLVYFLTCVVVIICKLKKDALKWEGTHYDPEAQKVKHKMIRQVKALICYPIVFLLLKLPLLLNQLYETSYLCEPLPVLWLLDALTSPLGGGLVALVYVCDANTRTKVRACCSNSMKMKESGGGGWCSACLAKPGSDPVDYSIDVDTVFGDSLEGELARNRFKKRAATDTAPPTTTTGIRNPTFVQSC